jgi:hypothetical protein
MKTTIGVLAYLAAGTALLTSIGRSRLQWDEPPTPARRAITVAAWPLILAMVLAGAWDFPKQESPTDEGEGA